MEGREICFFRYLKGHVIKIFAQMHIMAVSLILLTTI